MPARFPVILSDKASNNPAVSGLALTNEFANTAFPESSSKRRRIIFQTLNGLATTGVTPAELFIDGINLFRYRPVDTSTALCEVNAVYCSSAAASSCSITTRFTVSNRAGVVTILADSTTTRMPAVSTATLVPTVVGNMVVLTATGVAGDVNGRWKAEMLVLEVTDIG